MDVTWLMMVGGAALFVYGVIRWTNKRAEKKRNTYSDY